MSTASGWNPPSRSAQSRDELRTEMEELKQALREIAELSLEEHLGYGHERTLPSRMADLARAALAGREPQK